MTFLDCTDHYESMIDDGIPQAIEWLKSLRHIIAQRRLDMSPLPMFKQDRQQKRLTVSFVRPAISCRNTSRRNRHLLLPVAPAARQHWTAAEQSLCHRVAGLQVLPPCADHWFAELEATVETLAHCVHCSWDNKPWPSGFPWDRSETLFARLTCRSRLVGSCRRRLSRSWTSLR